MRWPDDTVTPCVSTPPLDQLLSTLAGGAAWVSVELGMDHAETRSAIALPLPGDQARALLLWPETTAGLAAPMVENLVNQIAHDVRNYAFTMGLQAEMGGRRTSGTPEASGHFDAVLRQVDLLRTYLDWLLLYGRQVRLSPATVDVAEFVRQEVQQLRFSQEAAAPPLSISIEAAPDCGFARWDRKAMGAALQAVLDNALRSASPPPTVAVRVAPEGNDLLVKVSDRGEGIPTEALTRLAVPMAVRRAGGAGLGLAIARKILRAHGGGLSLESGAQGTTVVFRIPREVASE